MPSLESLPEEMQMTLRKHGVTPETFDKPQRFSPDEMGVPRYVRLQIPTSTAGTADAIRLLDWLADQFRQLRRESIDQEWQYGSRLRTLVNAANLQLQKHTKSSGQK